MTRFITIVLVSAIVVALEGCKKDDDPEAASKIVGKWDLTHLAAEVTVPGGDLRLYLVDQLAMNPSEVESYVNYLESGEAAKLDVITIEFGSDGSYEAIGEGGSKHAGTWEITVADKAVIFDKATSSHTVGTVKTLTDTELVLKIDLSNHLGLPNMEYQSVMSFERK